MRLFWLVICLWSFDVVADIKVGIYQISGHHNIKGTYSGVIEVRPHGDKFEAIRIVTFENFKFENLRVQEVWTGVVSNSNQFVVQYQLRQADFLNAVGEHKRTAEDFVTPYNLSVKYSTENFSFFINEALYTERLSSTAPSSLRPEPLWKNERQIVDATGEYMPAVATLPYMILRMWIIPEYRDQEYPQKFAERAEFRKAKQYVVYDSTDYEFYQNNRDVLRVVNKVIDPISLVEAVTRRNAFAPTLHEKAQNFEKEMLNHHINELGMFTRNGVADGDSALWTGMYAGSQAMRYLKTGEPQALENFKKSLKGMMLLMDITQNPREFARTLALYKGQQLTPPWKRGTGVYSDYAYIEGGNNDMYKGLVHAFIWAFKVLPNSETELWNQLKSCASRLPELEVVDSKNSNKIPAYGLKAIANGDGVALRAYKKAFAKDKWPEEYGLDDGFYWGGIADFSGVNLTMVSLITNIMLADLANAPEVAARFRKSLMSNWKTYAPIRRDFLTVAAYTFAYRNGARPEEFSQETWDTSLSKSLWSLRDIPYPRSPYSASYDYRLRPDWCLSAWPDMPWKRLTGNPPPWEYHYQGAYDYPIFESFAFGSTYIWKDGAFSYRGSTSPVEMPSADYLYMYWMARYAGMLN